MIDIYLFYGLVAFYLIGAVFSVIFNKKDAICAYVPFLGASISALLGIIFSLSVIFGDTFSLSLSGESFLKFGFFVDSSLHSSFLSYP